jgi:hypothetical protein
MKIRVKQPEVARDKHTSRCATCLTLKLCPIGDLLQADYDKASEPSLEESEILDARPQLEEVDEIVLECWCTLDSCRPLGTMAAGPIPWTAIVQWAAIEDLDVERTRIVARVIRHLDAKRAERLTSELSLK